MLTHAFSMGLMRINLVIRGQFLGSAICASAPDIHGGAEPHSPPVGFPVAAPPLVRAPWRFLLPATGAVSGVWRGG